jgi:hypothetical protein
MPDRSQGPLLGEPIELVDIDINVLGGNFAFIVCAICALPDRENAPFALSLRTRVDIMRSFR